MTWRQIIDANLYLFLNDVGFAFGQDLGWVNQRNSDIYGILDGFYGFVVEAPLALLLLLYRALHDGQALFQGYATDLLSFVRDEIRGKWSDVVNRVNQAWQWVVNAWQNMTDAFNVHIQGFRDVWLNALNAAQWIFDTARAVLQGLVDNPLGWIWNVIIDALTSWIAWLVNAWNSFTATWNAISSIIVAFGSNPQGFVNSVLAATIKALFPVISDNLDFWANLAGQFKVTLLGFLADPPGYILAAVTPRVLAWITGVLAENF